MLKTLWVTLISVAFANTPPPAQTVQTNTVPAPQTQVHPPAVSATAAAKADDKKDAPETVLSLPKDKNTLIDWMAAARTSVDIALFAIDDDGMIKAINDLRGKGVKVRLFLQRPGLYHGKYSALESEKAIVNFQESVNSRVNHLIDPEMPGAIHALQQANYIIVDDTSVVVLNTSMTQKALSQGQNFAFLIRDKRTVENMKLIFDADFDQNSKAANDRARFYFEASRIILGPNKIIDHLIEFMRSARDEIIIATNSLDDVDLVTFLQRQAKENIKIKILMSSSALAQNGFAEQYLFHMPNVEIRTSKEISGDGLFIVLDGDTDRTKTFIGSITLNDATTLKMARSMGIGTQDKILSTASFNLLKGAWDKGETFKPENVTATAPITNNPVVTPSTPQAPSIPATPGKPTVPATSATPAQPSTPGTSAAPPKI